MIFQCRSISIDYGHANYISIIFPYNPHILVSQLHFLTLLKQASLWSIDYYSKIIRLKRKDATGLYSGNPGKIKVQ